MRAPMLAAAALASALLVPAAGNAAQSVATSRVIVPAMQVNGIGVAEISGLAWDADEQLLYAVSDQGYVYHFRIERNGEAMVAIQAVFAAALSDPRAGRDGAHSRQRFNAEGLTLRNAGNGMPGDSELIVALEENPPQIVRFSPKGALLGNLPVPPPVHDIDHYEKKGRGLEAVALHPDFDLLTAPESPLRTQPAGLHTVYANGHQWSFPRHAEGSRLKGLDLLPDGSLLVLERSRNGSKQVQVASLRRVDLATCHAGGTCKVARLATLPPGPENFEGMALLDAHHVLLASDNGGDPTQATTFILIELP